jgi:hypothetical protein
MIRFKQWLEQKYAEKHSPSKVKKLHRDETFNKGSRDLRDDLSKDYPGNIEFQGDVGPYKLLGKKIKEDTQTCSKCGKLPVTGHDEFQDIPANTWCNKCLGQYMVNYLIDQKAKNPSTKSKEEQEANMVLDMEKELRQKHGDEEADAMMARFNADPQPAWLKVMGWAMSVDHS